jgi:hypothetical protein
MGTPSFPNQNDPAFSPGGSHVTLSRPETFRNPVATRLRDDSGDLAWSEGRIRFRGQSTRYFKDVTDISLVRQPLNWLTIGLCNLLAVALTFGGVMRRLTPSNPITWLTFAVINGLLIVSSFRVKWLQVTYHPRPGTADMVYLVPIRPNGRPKPSADVERLCATLREAVLARRTTPDSAGGG